MSHCMLSDPFHERYGQHLSQEEVINLVAPHEENIQMVDKWLASHGIFEDSLTRSPARDWVKVKVPIGLAEDMLNTVSRQLWLMSISNDSTLFVDVSYLDPFKW